MARRFSDQEAKTHIYKKLNRALEGLLYSKDWYATLGAEAARNPLVKGEGIGLLDASAVADIPRERWVVVGKFLHFVQLTGFG